MQPQLEAEKQLMQIEAVSVPHMKTESAQGVLRRWTRRLHREPQETRQPTRDELLARLQASGIPITFTERPKGSRKSAGRAGTGRKGEVKTQ